MQIQIQQTKKRVFHSTAAILLSALMGSATAWAQCASTITIPGTPTAGNLQIKDTNRAAQTFLAPGASGSCVALSSVTFAAQKHLGAGGTLGALTVTVYTTTGGQPNTTIIGANATADTTVMLSADTFYDITATFSSPVSLVGGTTYAIVFTSSSTGSNYYKLGLLTTAYSDGAYWQGDPWDSVVGGTQDVKMTLCFVPCPAGGCTLTLGYWKNHTNTGDWPVTSLMLGLRNYTQAELLSILNASVVGNGLISLAHQLIATKLNIANGADGSAVTATITAADTAIGTLVVPPVGSDFLAPATVDSLGNTLDNYNNGLIGPGHCAE